MKEERSWPDVTTYNAAISVCERGGAWEEALWMLSELRHWHKPDVISYNACITACQRGAHWGRVLNLFREAVLCGVIPGSIGHGIAVASCSNGNQVSCAVDLFDACVLISLKPDLGSFSLTVNGFERSWQHPPEGFLPPGVLMAARMRERT